jgi:hypothetical protein
MEILGGGQSSLKLRSKQVVLPSCPTLVGIPNSAGKMTWRDTSSCFSAQSGQFSQYNWGLLAWWVELLLGCTTPVGEVGRNSFCDPGGVFLHRQGCFLYWQLYSAGGAAYGELWLRPLGYTLPRVSATGRLLSSQVHQMWPFSHLPYMAIPILSSRSVSVEQSISSPI